MPYKNVSDAIRNRKEYYLKNKKEIIKKNNDYRERTKEQRREKVKAYGQKRWIENKEKLNKWHKEWKEKNPEKMNEYSREWCSRNKDKRRQIDKNYAINNKEKIRKRENNYAKKRYSEDMNFRLRLILKKQLYRVLNYYTISGKIQSSSKYDIDWKPIIQKLMETKPKDFEYRPYAIDHIIACANFNLEDSEQVKKCFSPENIQWLPAEDNNSKGDKKDWVRLVFPPILEVK